MSAGTRVFVARLAGLPVFDPNGDQVGRVRDVVVALRIGKDAPRALGLVVEIQARRRQIRAEGRPEAEMEELFREESRRTAPLLAGGPHGMAVGAFEGAAYEARGYFRPRADCIMFTRNEVGFCPVCRRTLEEVIDLYAARR